MSQREAKIHIYETDMGDHYSVNLKDENGKVVSTQVMRTINEANEVKNSWERGDYQYLSE